jgi:hypothetical protein
VSLYPCAHEAQQADGDRVSMRFGLRRLLSGNVERESAKWDVSPGGLKPV